MDWMPQAIREGIMVVLIISGPLVVAAAVIGLVVGILQAATQVQEQTIGTAVKIIALFGLIMLSSFWMFQYLNQYMARTLNTAFTFVPHRSQKVISGDADLMGLESGGVPSFENRFMALEPMEIENKLPGGGAPPGVLLGSPKVPKAPIYRGASPNVPLPSNEIQIPKLDEPEQSLKLIPEKLDNNFIENNEVTE